MRAIRCLLVAVLLGSGTSRAGAPPAGDPAAYFPDRAWRTSTPEEQGIDSTSLLRMLEDIRDHGIGVDGVVIVRHGYLVLEAYVAPYDAGTAHNMKSSSKSVLSALVGIALREKVLDGLDQRVSELLPESFAAVDDPRKKAITLRHLLTMTAGFTWTEISPEADRLWASRDWVGAAVALPLADAPGARFIYGTPVTHLASAAIARRSGMSTRAFAEKFLFEPVGIRAGLWRRDPQGIEVGGADLFLTPRDMARFGYLYLHGGAWNGRQVVPREWVAESTRAQVKTAGWGGVDDYGYWWWIDPAAFMAVGLGGQVIAVVPEQDLVVVFTGAQPEHVPFSLFRTYVAPAVRSTPLPPNRAARRALSAVARELERPALRRSPIPAAASPIAARRYRLEPNPFGFTGLRLQCAHGPSCTVVLERPGQDAVLPVGLDGRYRVRRAPELGDLPVASKGEWSAADGARTFALWVVQVGDPVRIEARIRFAGDRAAITVFRKTFVIRTTTFEATDATAPPP